MFDLTSELSAARLELGSTVSPRSAAGSASVCRGASTHTLCAPPRPPPNPPPPRSPGVLRRDDPLRGPHADERPLAPSACPADARLPPRRLSQIWQLRRLPRRRRRPALPRAMYDDMVRLVRPLHGRAIVRDGEHDRGAVWRRPARPARDGRLVHQRAGCRSPSPSSPITTLAFTPTLPLALAPTACRIQGWASPQPPSVSPHPPHAGLAEQTEYELKVDDILPDTRSEKKVCDRFGRYDCSNDMWRVPPDLPVVSPAPARALPHIWLAAALALLATRCVRRTHGGKWQGR